MTEPAAGPGMRETVLTIEGMTCAACAARVKKKLNGLQGVSAAVNYATATARVTAPAGLPARRTGHGGRAGRVRGQGARGRPGRGDEDAADERDAARDAAYLKRRLFVALVFFVPLTDLSLMLSLIPSLRFAGWQWLLVGCAAPVALWCAWPFHRAALKNARHGSASMDTLVSLGIIAACGWSVYAMFVLDRAERGGSFWQLLIHASGGGIYLETAATVTTFLLAGRLYEARARRVAGQAMRELAAAGASDAGLLGPDGTERRVPASSLRPGDRFVVRPGEAIAADGEVVFGQSAVDRSMMTGESVPGEAAEGDSVIGGTVALTGRLVVRAVRTGRDTQLSQLIRLVEQAQAQKAAIQRIADRICAVFVPAVLGCAVLTLAGWLLAGAPAGHAVSAGLAVLIIACPCALGLATPGGAGRRLRPRRPAGDLHQGLPGSGVIPVGPGRGAGQDGDGHHRADVTGRRPAIRRRQPDGRAQVRGRGGAGVRARGGRRDQRGRAKRNRATAGSERFQGAARARGARDRRRPCGHRRPRDAIRRVRHDRPGQPGRAMPGLGGSRLHRRAGRVGR